MSAKIFGMWKAWEKKLNGSGKRSWIPGPPKKTVLAGVDPRLKQVALDRLAILREYHLRLSKPGRHKTKTEVMRIFLHDLRSGIFWLDAIKYPIS